MLGCQSRGQATAPAGREASNEAVEARLQTELKEVISRGNGASAEWIGKVESNLWRTFQALPKTSQGFVSTATARYALQTHLARAHGWLIKGIEPHGMKRSCGPGLHTVQIFRDRAPALARALKEARDCAHSFQDLVVLYVALERLVFDESRRLLEASYILRNKSMQKEVSEGELLELLVSYLVLFKDGRNADLSLPRKHAEVLAKRLASAHRKEGEQASRTVVPSTTGFKDMITLARETTAQYVYAHRRWVNHFKPMRFSFDMVLRIVEDVAERFAPWQDVECRALKALLMRSDRGEAGRITLSQFYELEDCRESTAYLRQIGALDESSERNPRVVVSNYMYGPNNCIAHNAHFSTCCFNGCLGLLNELEGAIQAPSASVERVLRLMSNLSSEFPSLHMDAPLLSKHLVLKLYVIGEMHGGQVPLHGRLFAQWLHFLFPDVCPYPQIIHEQSALTRNHYERGNFRATPEEIKSWKQVTSWGHIDAPLSQWSDDEVLPLHDLQGHDLQGHVSWTSYIPVLLGSVLR